MLKGGETICRNAQLFVQRSPFDSLFYSHAPAWRWEMKSQGSPLPSAGRGKAQRGKGREEQGSEGDGAVFRAPGWAFVNCSVRSNCMSGDTLHTDRELSLIYAYLDSLILLLEYRLVVPPGWLKSNTFCPVCHVTGGPV